MVERRTRSRQRYPTVNSETGEDVTISSGNGILVSAVTGKIQLTTAAAATSIQTDVNGGELFLQTKDINSDLTIKTAGSAIDIATTVAGQVDLRTAAASSPLQIHTAGTSSPIDVYAVDANSDIGIRTAGAAAPIDIHTGGAAAPIDIYSAGDESDIELATTGTHAGITLDTSGAGDGGGRPEIFLHTTGSLANILTHTEGSGYIQLYTKSANISAEAGNDLVLEAGTAAVADAELSLLAGSGDTGGIRIGVDTLPAYSRGDVRIKSGDVGDSAGDVVISSPGGKILLDGGANSDVEADLGTGDFYVHSDSGHVTLSAGDGTAAGNATFRTMNTSGITTVYSAGGVTVQADGSDLDLQATGAAGSSQVNVDGRDRNLLQIHGGADLIVAAHPVCEVVTRGEPITWPAGWGLAGGHQTDSLTLDGSVSPSTAQWFFNRMPFGTKINQVLITLTPDAATEKMYFSLLYHRVERVAPQMIIDRDEWTTAAAQKYIMLEWDGAANSAVEYGAYASAVWDTANALHDVGDALTTSRIVGSNNNDDIWREGNYSLVITCATGVSTLIQSIEVGYRAYGEYP